MNNVGCSSNFYFIAVKTKNEKSLTCERCKESFYKTYTGLEYKIGKKVFCSYNCREKYRKEHYNKKEERDIMNDIYVGEIYKQQIRFTYLVKNDEELKLGFFTIKTNTKRFSKQDALNVLTSHFAEEKNRVGKRKDLIVDTIQVRQVVLKD